MLRTINDRVYGEIAVSGVASRLLSNRWLVRLDYIRQLGACSFVYPSATHTRREHSIGVYHLSGIMAAHIQTLNPYITDDDVELVRIAGLLHDVGHGPFSHMYESFWRDQGVLWCHEKQTMRILEDELMRELYIERRWTHTVQENFNFISGLITGVVNGSTGRDAAVVHSLVDVVHSHAGVDADRMDYLLRDTLCVFGSTHTVDALRIIHSIRIVNGCIAFDNRVALSIQQLFELRTRLHKQVYQHRDVLVVETMLKKHMKRIDPCTLDDFCDLTDACVLSGAHLCRVHQYPRMSRVHLNLLIPTSPLCPCGYEYLESTRFCPMCGAPESKGHAPPLHHLTGPVATDYIRRVLGVADVYILISDVTYGTLSDVPFHNNGRQCVITDDGGRPSRYHSRKVYCYTESDAGDETLGVRVKDALSKLWSAE
jgi:hypothetical protein